MQLKAFISNESVWQPDRKENFHFNRTVSALVLQEPLALVLQEPDEPFYLFFLFRKKNTRYNRRPLGRCRAVPLDRAAEQYFRGGLLYFFFIN